MAVILKTGNTFIVDADPTSTAVNANQGTMIIFNGTLYCKMTDGENTDVIKIVPVDLISGMALGSWNPSANLIAHYPLDDKKSTTVVKDVSSNDFDGVMNGGDTTDISVDGLVSVGKAHDFNGSSQFHNIDLVIQSGNLPNATKGTLAIVTEPDIVATDSLRFFSFGDANAVEEIAFMQGAADGTVRAWCRIAGTMQWDLETNNAVISNGTKVWIILVHNGTEAKFFVGDAANGMREVASTFSIDLAKSKWFNDATGLDSARIGVKFVNGSTGKYMDATLDDARIYDSDWSIDDAIGWFNNANGTQSESGMIPWTAAEMAAYLARPTDDATKYLDGKGNFTVPSGGSSDLGKNHIAGLITSNDGTDADHDINIAIGEARDADDGEDMALASALIKKLDAAWAVGTNAGGIDTGSIAADTTYAIWLIKRTATNVVDVLFSTSFTAPTMPTNYDKKRLIGFANTDSASNWLEYAQKGDYFYHGDATSLLDVNDSTITHLAWETATISGPPNCLVGMSCDAVNTATTSDLGFVSLRSTGTNLGDPTARIIESQHGSDADVIGAVGYVFSDSSKQIDYTARESGGTTTVKLYFRDCNMLTRSNPV